MSILNWDGADMSATISKLTDAHAGLAEVRRLAVDAHGTVAGSLGGAPGTGFTTSANEFDLHFGDLFTAFGNLLQQLGDTHRTYTNSVVQATDAIGSIRNQINL
jgi:hypothetical protein